MSPRTVRIVAWIAIGALVLGTAASVISQAW